MYRKVFVFIVVIVALAAASSVSAIAGTQIPLAPGVIPQFVEPLPLLDVAEGSMLTADGTQPVKVLMCEFKAYVLPKTTVLPNGSAYTGTWVWGYLPATYQTATCADLIDTYGDESGVLETYIGPVVLATRGIPTEFTWINSLGNSLETNVLAYKNSTDQTLHWADPLNNSMNDCNHLGGIPEPGSPCAQNYDGPIPAVVHLHGGEVPPQLDGGPDAWITSDGQYSGQSFYSKYDVGNGAVYTYPNSQEAAPIWFHDHTLGATRLNVYAGLAGAYLLNDPNMVLPVGLHAYGLSYSADNTTLDNVTVPLVIQDRSFDQNGELFYQADSNGGVLWTPNPEHPYWNPEFVGETIVVNGKTWPYLSVEPKRYRLLFLNGSNARSYEMFLVDPQDVAVEPNFWVISTDGGYLDNAVQVKKLVMMPGERYEVIVDFSGVAPGTNLVLKNTARTPFPGGATPKGATTGQIMQFRVGDCISGTCGASDTSYNPAASPSIRSPGQQIERLVNPATGAVVVPVQVTRQLTLNEVMNMPMTVASPVDGTLTTYPGGPLEVLVNNTKWDGGVDHMGTNECLRDDFYQATSVSGITTCYSETPNEGDTEVWEIVNLTADAHPIHLHLVQFQIISRQNFDLKAYDAFYNASFPTGVYEPGYGPPMSYDAAENPLSGGKYGGNPDVFAVGKNNKALYMRGKASPAETYEVGWKDTVVVYPGQVTRIVVRWAPTDVPANTPPSDSFFPFDPSGEGFISGYVWHCHIIDHEDNEMMRPNLVVPNGNSRDYLLGTDF